MYHAYPESGLAYVWTLLSADMQGGGSGELVSGQLAAKSEAENGLMLMARKLVISNSIP